MTWLIEAVYELSAFRTHLSTLLEKQVEKSRQKSKLIEDIKKQDMEMKILKEDTDAHENKVKTEEEIKKNLSRIEGQKKDKDIDDMKRELYKMESQINKMDNALTKLKREYKETKSDAKFMIHPNALLGYDKERNQYWFFSMEPSKLFVRKPQANEKMPFLWFCYTTEEEVTELKHSLNLYGLREKNLYNQLDYFTNDEFLELEKIKKKKNTMDIEDGAEGDEKNEDLATNSNELKMDEEMIPEEEEEEEDLKNRDFDAIYNETFNEIFEYHSMYKPRDGRKPKTRRTDNSCELLDSFREMMVIPESHERASVGFLATA